MQAQDSYISRAADAVQNAGIAVQVLLSADHDDVAFWPLRPRVLGSADLTSSEEFAARRLRSVGIIALHGATPHTVLKEPLPNCVVDAICAAFVEYVRTLLGQSLVTQTAASEVADLERLFMLPDTRPELG